MCRLVTELVFISHSQGQELCYLVAINTSVMSPSEKPFYSWLGFKEGLHIFRNSIANFFERIAHPRSYLATLLPVMMFLYILGYHLAAGTINLGVYFARAGIRSVCPCIVFVLLTRHNCIMTCAICAPKLWGAPRLTALWSPLFIDFPIASFSSLCFAYSVTHFRNTITFLV